MTITGWHKLKVNIVRKQECLCCNYGGLFVQWNLAVVWRMNEWMGEWMHGWVNGCMNGWVNGCLDGADDFMTLFVLRNSLITLAFPRD